MAAEDLEKSLSDEATYAARVGSRHSPADQSIGDGQTLGGDDGSGFAAVVDDIEVVDLESRYTIEGMLGQGGMGAVLLATDTRLGRKVAIKRILGEAARSKTATQRFLTEAKAIAALNHANIVQIYDYGQAKDGPFLIMEYVDGGSLLDRCREGALPLEHAIDLACQLCNGLSKAHDAGIIHRDIKPANVLLSADGIPKLTDFGLAKAEASDHGMTMTGFVMGTPDFMPPEQRRDASLVDPRSDLWSLAATVYQMVTGRSPQIIRFNDLPAALQDVLAKALEEEKASRYQSARELRDALKECLLTSKAGAEELVEGSCLSCGSKNALSRRFCRRCGQSLEAECLSCVERMPLWEEICGVCGAKQTPLVEAHRQEAVTQQAEAERLLGKLAFEEAARIAKRLRDEAHPRLQSLAAWAATFLEQIEAYRAEQIQHAVDALTEAGRHEAAHDYLSAINALETVPRELRLTVLPGSTETVGSMLTRVRKTQAEVKRLELRVKELVNAKKFDDLLPDVETLLGLRPDRCDVQNIHQKLVERRQSQIADRDEAIVAAQARFWDSDYEGAIAALRGVASAAVTPEVVRLREQAEERVREVRGLASKIKDAVAAKQLDGLLDTVEAYLNHKPTDDTFVALRGSLIAREEKLAAEIQAQLEQAETLWQLCRFYEVYQLIADIPPKQCSSRGMELSSRSKTLGPLRQAALNALARVDSAKEFRRVISKSSPYSDALAEAGLTDIEFEALRSEAASLVALRAAAVQAAYRRYAGLVILGLLVAVGGPQIWRFSSSHTDEVVAKNAGMDRLQQDLFSAVPAVTYAQDTAGKAELQRLGQRIAKVSPDRNRLAEELHELNPQEEITNSIGMRMKLIPAGTFSIGSADGDSDESPVHEMTILRSYHMGVYEVTNGQWQAVMGDVPGKWKNAERPVEHVSWDDVAKFCNGLSALPAERRAGRVYRLPTEAEWEYACRAGTTTAYSFGDNAAVLGDFAWVVNNSGRQTHTVGQKQPNAWGLYDMHGNVWEWCSDYYGDYASGAARDPAGAPPGSPRVLRGGCWISPAWNCRSAIRRGNYPSLRTSLNGFRLALSPPGASSPEAGE